MTLLPDLPGCSVEQVSQTEEAILIIDTGVVSVTSLWADERVYYPVDFEPYTPAQHFVKGKQDPQFRTKLKIAVELVR
jgi:hypothetical protein